MPSSANTSQANHHYIFRINQVLQFNGDLSLCDPLAPLLHADNYNSPFHPVTFLPSRDAMLNENDLTILRQQASLISQSKDLGEKYYGIAKSLGFDSIDILEKKLKHIFNEIDTQIKNLKNLKSLESKEIDIQRLDKLQKDAEDLVEIQLDINQLQIDFMSCNQFISDTSSPVTPIGNPKAAAFTFNAKNFSNGNAKQIKKIHAALTEKEISGIDLNKDFKFTFCPANKVWICKDILNTKSYLNRLKHFETFAFVMNGRDEIGNPVLYLHSQSSCVGNNFIYVNGAGLGKSRIYENGLIIIELDTNDSPKYNISEEIGLHCAQFIANVQKHPLTFIHGNRREVCLPHLNEEVSQRVTENFNETIEEANYTIEQLRIDRNIFESNLRKFFNLYKQLSNESPLLLNRISDLFDTYVQNNEDNANDEVDQSIESSALEVENQNAENLSHEENERSALTIDTSPEDERAPARLLTSNGRRFSCVTPLSAVNATMFTQQNNFESDQVDAHEIEHDGEIDREKFTKQSCGTCKIL